MKPLQLKYRGADAENAPNTNGRIIVEYNSGLKDFNAKNVNEEAR